MESARFLNGLGYIGFRYHRWTLLLFGQQVVWVCQVRSGSLKSSPKFPWVIARDPLDEQLPPAKESKALVFVPCPLFNPNQSERGRSSGCDRWRLPLEMGENENGAA